MAEVRKRKRASGGLALVLFGCGFGREVSNFAVVGLEFLRNMSRISALWDSNFGGWRPRISAVEGADFKGEAGLGNWRFMALGLACECRFLG